MSVRELFGAPGYRRLFAEARRRIEEAGFRDADGVRVRLARSIRLRGLDPEERRALAGLLGLPALPGSELRIPLDHLDAALRSARCATGLEAALEALGGPLQDRRDQRAEAGRAVERMWQEAYAAVSGRPPLSAWLDGLREEGLLKRVAGRAGLDEAELLTDCLRVVSRLPAAEGIGLAVLAVQTLDDAHALDPGQPAAGLVLRAAAHLSGRARAHSSAERRALWASVGVLCDPLSSQVLVHGLRPSGGGRLARALNEAAEAGEPVRVTLRELERGALAWAGGEAFVCENPGIVAAAADALGARCRALVCTEGVPSLAAGRVIEGLRGAGVALHVRADFDWAGIRIGNALLEGGGAVPWRFRAADYLSFAEGGEGIALAGAGVVPCWDPLLGEAMERVGIAVFEEQLLEGMLGDLAAGL